MPEYFTPSQVGRKLGVTAYTVREWIKAGKLKALKSSNGRLRITDEQFKEYMEKEWGSNAN